MFLVIQGCPCNPQLAPYIELLRRETGATINSIYRGDDAATILHRHGKHTQRECYERQGQPGFGPANPPGRSTHELHSDGVAYPGPVGRHLDWWQQGLDVDDIDVHHMIAAAKTHGWVLKQPYKSGAERHHLNFALPPKPASVRSRMKLIWLRGRLPRR